MSLAHFQFTDRAHPIVEVGVGDTRIAASAGQWDQAHWDTDGDVWSGVDPTWLDITCDCFSYACEYGRARTIDRFVAGSATVVVHNATGWADPHAIEAPGQLTMRPGRPIRMGVVHDTYGTRWLFRGFIDAMNPTYDPVEMDTVEFACIDALGEINRAQLPELATPIGAGDSIDVRIGRILDAAKWPTTKRDLAPASDTVIAHNLAGQVADLLGQVADSGGGSVFGDLDGNVVFRARDWQTFVPGTPPDGTIGNVEPGHTIPGTPQVDGYLTPTVGVVTTPDPGPLPAQCVWVVRVRSESSGFYDGIAGQWSGAAGYNWLVAELSDQAIIQTTGSTERYNGWFPDADAWFAVSLDQGAADGPTVRWDSPNGVTWTAGSPVTTPPLPDETHAAQRLAIGALSDGFNQPFHGRIYSVELRTGLDPAPTGRYLTPTVGTVTTPDPGPLPNDCTFVFKRRGRQNETGSACLASQFDTGGQRSWRLDEPGGMSSFLTGQDGDFGGIVQTQLPRSGPADQDRVFAASITLNDAGTRRMTMWEHNGITFVQGGTVTAPSLPAFDSSDVIRIGAWDSTQAEPYDGRIYSVELRTGLDPAAGTVVWRFDADEAPTDATTTTWTDPRGRTWTVSDPQAISGRTLWRFDANDYPGTGTSYADPRGRTWTLTDAAAITPKIPAVPEVVVPADICPTQWERPFTRADMTTRVIIGRDTETAQLIDDTPAQNAYGIEPFTRTDLLTESDATITRLGQRILRTRAAATSPRIRSVSLDAATATNALDLMATVDVYLPSRYRCRLQYPRGTVFDAEHFATAVSHNVTPTAWTVQINLDLAAPWAAAGGRWDDSFWDQATWGETVALAAEARELDRSPT